MENEVHIACSSVEFESISFCLRKEEVVWFEMSVTAYDWVGGDRVL
jgi:hypothetical protein